MKKLNNNIKFIYVLVICSLIINFLSTINIIPKIDIIMPIIWLVIFILGIILTKNDYNHFFDVKDKIYNLLIVLIIYFMIYFSLGLIFTYSYNAYQNNTILDILKNIYIYIIPLIFQEYIREIFCNYSNKNKTLYIIISIIFIFINLNISNNIFHTGETFLKFLCMNVIPLICSEFVLTYLCSVGSFKLSLIYKLLITIFNIFLPILPNLNFFLIGIINTLLPVIIYYVIDYYYQKEIKKVYIEYKKHRILDLIPVFICIIIIVLNYFDLFKYKSIAILSNSMNPLYYKGDAVIVKILSDQEKEHLNIGDIISYIDDDGNTIIHRIYNINFDEKTIIAKGDNNLNVDSKKIEFKNIKGKYLFHIKYLGLINSSIYDMLNN